MRQSLYTQFKTIPVYQRDNAYSNSIKMHHNLWVLPTYEIGEVWEWYGGGSHGQYEVIQVLSEHQILFKIHPVKVKSMWSETGFYMSHYENELFYVGTRRGPHKYIDCGTPQLRKRVK